MKTGGGTLPGGILFREKKEDDERNLSQRGGGKIDIGETLRP